MLAPRTLKANDNTITSIRVIQTPHGPFKRSQLEIRQDKHSEIDNMFIEGRISFKGNKNGTPKTLQVNCSLLEDSNSSGTNNSSGKFNGFKWENWKNGWCSSALIQTKAFECMNIQERQRLCSSSGFLFSTISAIH